MRPPAIALKRFLMEPGTCGSQGVQGGKQRHSGFPCINAGLLMSDAMLLLTFFDMKRHGTAATLAAVNRGWNAGKTLELALRRAEPLLAQGIQQGPRERVEHRGVQHETYMEFHSLPRRGQ